MAHDAHDREDLLRDARGLSPRLQLEFSSATGPVELFAGFRGESLSLYFDQDLVFHFNDRGELRRAFIADLLLKSEGGRLVSMRRDRSETEVSLVSRPLEPGAERSLLVDLERRLQELADALVGDKCRVVGEVPMEGNAVVRLRAWLAARSGPIELAASPHVG